MTVYDGGSSTSPMMGMYWGGLIPPSHISSSNEVLIQFHSDQFYVRAGFKMEYNSAGKRITSIQNNNELWRYITKYKWGPMFSLVGFTNHTEFDYSPI